MSQFYRAFEDEHRGSHDTIKQRLQVYLPFITPLLKLYPECRAVDVGCGRGEWLETLIENGFDATGVDLDEGMLEACQARSLPAEKAEAVAYLQSLPDESLTVLSGFHIVEHIPFDALKSLVSEANRVLKPGGLLILETPNAENLIVGTQNFYLDPTHERPIPHMLLEFLVNFSGFQRSKLMRLQESPRLVDSLSPTLMEVLGGASPDYAIVAQKAPDDVDLSAFDAVFEGSYGLSLADLAQRYEASLATKTEEQRQRWDTDNASVSQRLDALEYDKAALHKRADFIENENTVLHNRVDFVEHEHAALLTQLHDLKASMSDLQFDELKLANDALQRSLDESLKNAHHWYTEVLAHQQHIATLGDASAYHHQTVSALTEQIQQLRKSTSWRVTAPMRQGVIVTRKLVSSPVQTSRHLARTALKRVLDQPRLRTLIKKILVRHPPTYVRLQKLAARLRAAPAAPFHNVAAAAPQTFTAAEPGHAPAAPAHLSENAKAIYLRLNRNEPRKDVN
ncbi:class I SAM-dependent methyltransferase [Pseudomonas sp. RP23018S]|uniref:class I SAM-dependent methyltransferase n=1 Tax=Pseudomonas sp. RP23018S TaxID=3096037 RepID=UPI002ACA0A81|nr:class I SAM-dependent methyltransferase [Pseudomonas sp. RP23018S]MDZ5601441.1 class I SAM-dependent methyltransferase [Pseudomonas sp. RP23018S]